MQKDINTKGDRGADRLNQLAMERTVLAVERTYAAWIRTGLGAVAGGPGLFLND